MFEDWRCGRKVKVVKFCNGQAEVFQLVVAVVETGQDGIVVVDPTLYILGDIEANHA